MSPHVMFVEDGCRLPYLRLILTSKVYEIISETPLVRAHNLSTKLGNDIWLKREDVHDVFSFKIRGAYNFMASLPDDHAWKGVISGSAGTVWRARLSSHRIQRLSGNHAQGVALSGSRLNIPC